jgi:tRNA modification GTPase
LNPDRDTIAALATPAGQGGLAILRLSGPRAFPIATEVFRGPSGPPRTQIFGRIVREDGSLIDEVLLTRFTGPKSFTGEDTVEITCHGGRLVSRAILDRLLHAGARAAQGGEFTQRAFLNGKLDLTQAEAVMDVISAQTDLALRCAQRQLQGHLGERVEHLRQALIAVLAHLEAWIDFPEEDIDPETGEQLNARILPVLSGLEQLRATARQGRILREGVATVICGSPNVGKSSLLNLLLGFERAIVSEIAGTTRDTLEEVLDLEGIPLRLIDTAGLRDSADLVELQGMARTGKSLEEAELVLEVCDGHLPPRPSAVEVPPGALHLRILNKMDLGLDPGWNQAPDILPLSCLTGEGLAHLKATVVARLTSDHAGSPDAWNLAVNARHLQALNKARDHLRDALDLLAASSPPELAAVDLRSALHQLAEIVGRTDIEEILDVVFSRFCIGK